MSEKSSRPRVLVLPGLYGSGPEHWQTQWERRHADFRRVEQQEWNTPDCETWLATLDAAIRSEADRVILVGHSLGSITIAHWAERYGRRIAGALLVAPSDTEAASFPAGTSGFAPIPQLRFPFASTVIASSNDPYMSLERSEALAQAWGSELVALGAHGHISAGDGFGPWPEGERYLARFFAEGQG
jgi:uncharacterized protein